MRTKTKYLLFSVLCIIQLLTMGGCVDQKKSSVNIKTSNNHNPRIVATSVAVMEICEKLDLDLIGVPSSELVEIPEKYKDATIVGSPMNPDLEILASLNPDCILSPSSLSSDLQPKYEAAGLDSYFLDLKSVTGMYQSIQKLGTKFNREERATELVEEFDSFYVTYKEKHQEQKGKKILLLMGLPGSYVVATEHSYAGSLVELAGGQNVYAGTEEEFLNVNVEDMLQKEPDIILRTAHALPKEVQKMFEEEFKTNDIWKHFSAVQEGRVYDLPSGEFGMSATFDYPEALSYLETILYNKE